MITFNRIGFVTLSILLLAGCEKTREFIGLEKSAPDEFAVYSRAPLSLPPDYSLKPPAPGESRPQASEPRRDARTALLGRNAGRKRPSPQDGSPGLQALLRATGGDLSDPNIRSQINAETSILAEEDKSITDMILFFATPTEYGSAVDPAREAERIQANQALGNPITEGRVPTLKRKRKGLLEGVID